jgi:membrane protease YdiL (CAAX protease family)
MTEYIPPRPDTLHPASPTQPPMPVGGSTSIGRGGRPPVTWSWYEAIGVYLLAFLIAGFAALPVVEVIDDEDLASIAASVVAALVIVGVLLFWLRRYHPTWREAIGLPTRIWPEVRAGVLFGLALYPAILFVVGGILALLLRAISGHDVSAPEQVSTHLPAYGTALTVAYALVIAPAGEELFFRGILFRSLRQRYGLVIGLIASASAFGLIHYIPGAWQDSVLLMGVMVFTGIALAWFQERRDNLIANIVAHMTFNVIGLTLIYAIR